MKIAIEVLFLVCICFSVKSQQKPIIDTGMVKSWPSLNGDAKISNDGRYAAFTVSNQPVGYNTLTITETSGKWTSNHVLSHDFYLTDFYFTNDSRSIYWQIGDSLFLQSLGQSGNSLIGVLDYLKTPLKDKGRWILYREKGSKDSLVLMDLAVQNKHVFSQAKDGVFDNEGNHLALHTINPGGKSILKLINLQNFKERIIFEDSEEIKISSLHFDNTGKQFAFMLSRWAGTEIYYYGAGMSRAVNRLNNNSKILNNEYHFSHINGFTQNGKWLFVKLTGANQGRPEPAPSKDLAEVDVWSYRDEFVIPAQPLVEKRNNGFDLVLEIASERQGIILNSDGLYCRHNVNIPGDYTIISSDTLEEKEDWWPHSPKPSEWLVSLKDGSRRMILKEHGNIQWMLFSPGGKWVTWWDLRKGLWMSYEVATGRTFNLSETVPVILSNDAEYLASSLKHAVENIAGWYNDDKFLVLYDNYDFWKVEPSGSVAPINLTGGYGRKNKIEFRIFKNKDVGSDAFNGAENLTLVGFNRNNKFNSLWRYKLGDVNSVKSLMDGPFTIFRYGTQAFPGGMKPVQAKNTKGKSWIIMRQSTNEFPNYYYTEDFQRLIPLTKLQPQQEYNWHTAELFTWTLPDGRQSQGVIYKPEDFDSSKKYPVIFNYYEKRSHRVHDFQFPGLSGSQINTPYFTSRGYIVCQPDIYYGNSLQTGITSGRYALHAVESAARQLIKRAYIDSNKLAINGHSFGGLETNYIATHSKMFAAAAEGAGFTDAMSSYLSLNSFMWPNTDKTSIQGIIERGHQLYFVTPWEAPHLYLDNSPVWSADKIECPLLIFHNKNDDQVPWRQGVEMYLALRRLGKPCWMLQYDNSAHTLDNLKDQLDFTIRLTQFFDHYLKEKPAPRWMTQGIPARLKQVENRYELSTSGNCSKECKICRHE